MRPFPRKRPGESGVDGDGVGGMMTELENGYG